MIFRKFILIFALIFLITANLYSAQQAEEESDQQIGEFSLTGYGEKGKRSWDLSGKSADIFTEIVKLKSVVGNLYGKEEDVKLTADKGDFNKADGKVHLEQNVVITTSSGTKLTTDSLDWDRKASLVTTKDLVNIQRQNMVTTGTGAVGQMGLKQVSLQKDVTVNILPQPKSGQPLDATDKTVITCDGPLQIDYAKNIATFNNNVKVDRADSVMHSDKMDVYFSANKDKASSGSDAGGLSANKIDKIIARGNVEILRGDNVSYSEEATYHTLDKKIILSGRPKLIIYSGEGLQNASIGN